MSPRNIRSIYEVSQQVWLPKREARKNETEFSVKVDGSWQGWRNRRLQAIKECWEQEKFSYLRKSLSIGYPIPNGEPETFFTCNIL